MAKNYGSWSLPDLKAELRRRKARISGRKADLVERLEAYDRNSNFGGVETIQEEYLMELPDATLFKDLHRDISVPSLGMDHVENYLGNRDKKMDKRAINLYDNNFINFVRVCCKENVFFTCQIRAEMKKNVAYKVDICISKQSVILQCQCECASGMGPSAHCKHVTCLLLGLVEFGEKGTIKTLVTCTQALQTFHQAKKHLGSPVKARDLKVHVNTDIDFDPRRPMDINQEGYADYAKNIIINEQMFSSTPINHILPPANPYAVCNDHDYFATSACDKFLQDSKLVTMSETEKDVIERRTREDRKLWRQERMKRICSSSFGAVCKLTERANKVKFVKRLTGGREFKTPATLHGKQYEDVAVKQYENDTGRTTSRCGLFVSEHVSYLASTPDRVVSETVLLEVKCPYNARDKMISEKTVPYLILSDCGDFQLKKTHDYYYQVQGQMMCVGPDVEEVHFCVYTFQDFRIINVKRDERFISEMLKSLHDFHVTYHKDAVLEKFFFQNYGELFC